MSIIVVGSVVGVAVVAYIIYQLVKSKKAVTVASVVAQATTDASVAKADAKKL